MPVVDYLARPLLASIFIASGADTMLKPSSRVEMARPVVERLSAAIPALPSDPETAIRINGAVQCIAGLSLAAGRFPRLAALVLAASLVPTTAAGHRFWEHEDPAARRQQRSHLLKNASILGGLLLAATNRGGAPSLGWRARKALRRTALPLPLG
ncbi:MAG: DoxX family protein [Mycobacteriales bacterium]